MVVNESLKESVKSMSRGKKKKLNKKKALSVIMAGLNCFNAMAPMTIPIVDALQKAPYANHRIVDKYATMLNHGGEILDGLLVRKAYADEIGIGYSSNTQDVSSGTISGTVIHAGGQQSVYENGIVSGTVVSSGGVQYVYSNGIASGTVVSSGGVQDVYSNGIASGTVVSFGGMQYVYSNGTASGTQVSSGGWQCVYGYGIASGTQVSSGGVQNVYSNGIASGTVVSAGGQQYVYGYGIASGTVVSSGGMQNISGGTVSSTQVNSGGTQNVSGGDVGYTSINSGGTQNVSGGIVWYTSVNSGGTQNVSGGIVYDTSINSGGTQNVSSGDVWYTSVNSGGTQNVSGGTVISTTVNSNGIQIVLNGGNTTNTIVNSGGIEIVSSGGTTIDTTINSGGLLNFEAGADILGNTTLNSGTVNIGGSGDAGIYALNANGGTVNFNPTGYNHTLNVNTLTGNGATFQITTDSPHNTGNQLSITSGSGNHNIAIIDTAMQNGVSSNLTTPLIILTNGGGASFNVIPTDSGAYRYTPTLVQDAGGIWRFTSFAPTVDNSGIIVISEAASTSKDSLIAGLGIMRTENNNLMKRMGDLRHSQGEGGAWARFYTGKQELNLSRSLDHQYNALQLGYDKKIKGSNGIWYTGLALNRIEGNTTYQRGSGDNNSTSLGVYGTWLGNKGHYLDIIAKLMWLNTQYNSWDLLNNQTYGSYNNRGTSFSLEYGYQKQLSQGWYIEPQLEAIFGHLGSVDYQDSQGMKIHLDSINSTIGRVGFLLGRQVGKEKSTNFYLKASIAREFNGKVKMKADSLNLSEELKDTWYEIGLGVTSQINKDGSIYLDLEKVDGHKVDSPWKLNLGLRWKL